MENYIRRNKLKLVLDLARSLKSINFQENHFFPSSLKMMLHANPASAPLLSYYDDESNYLKEGIKTEALAVDQSAGRASFLEAIKLAFHWCWRFIYKAFMQITFTLSQMKEEMKHLFTLALPMVISSLLIYGKMAISMHFLGRIDKDTLAGGSLAIGVANITGYSIISGLASGMEGISAQAYGARKWKLMAQTLQCTIIILILTCIPISFLWLNIEPILIHLCGQNPTISSISTTYLAFSLPDLFFQALINPFKIYLRTQNVTIILMVSASLSLLLHVTINYVIVHYFSLGIRGIALAGDITSLSILLILLFYLWFSEECSHSWRKVNWSFEFSNQWKPILHQAIPSCVSVCLEWWWYEILLFFSGLLHNASDTVATSGIIIQATALLYSFPFALSLAVSTRVGNELGANRPNNAKTSSLTALCCAFFIGTISLLFTMTVRNTWGLMFTQDQDILSLLASTLPIIALCEIGNCPQTTICGVLRGSARPSHAAFINFVSFYVVGLPVAVVMGFCFELGFLGLWMGLLAAQFVCAIMMVIVLTITDWELQAERARELMGRDNLSCRENDEAVESLISVQLLN